MQSHLSITEAPYRLPGEKLCFHDWRYLQPGYPSWKTDSGESQSLYAVDPVPAMWNEYNYTNTPGLVLKPLQAVKSDPVLTPDNSPFPFFIHPGSVIYEDGLYRLWYEYWPVEGFGGKQTYQLEIVCYGESEDGFTWRFPKQNRLDSEIGCSDIAVYGSPFVPDTSCHGASVFKDPSAGDSERYKMFYQGRARGDMLSDFLKNRPDAVQPRALKEDFGHGLFGAVSPDGLSWTPLEAPLLLQGADTHNICEYDTVRKTYVAYIRDHIMGRRTIGRTESPDFRTFPPPEPVFWPGPTAPHTDLWYANGKNTIPGGDENGDYHVMFPMRWNVATDRYDFFLAVSPDNVVWHLFPDGPVCEAGELGSWEGECVWPGRGMVPLPDDRMGIFYCGMRVPHKHPRRAPLGGLAWATWETDRLVALEAPAEGRFQTVPLSVKGRRIRLNARTKVGGYVRVEVIRYENGKKGSVIPGHTFKECRPFTGNDLDHPITWNGGPDLNYKEGDSIGLRIEMRHAELFAIRFA